MTFRMKEIGAYVQTWVCMYVCMYVCVCVSKYFNVHKGVRLHSVNWVEDNNEVVWTLAILFVSIKMLLELNVCLCVCPTEKRVTGLYIFPPCRRQEKSWKERLAQ